MTHCIINSWGVWTISLQPCWILHNLVCWVNSRPSLLKAIGKKERWSIDVLTGLLIIVLNILFIDELNQFITFALSFRTKICNLRSSLLSRILGLNSLTFKVSILLMTATITKPLIQILHDINGVSIVRNYIW